MNEQRIKKANAIFDSSGPVVRNALLLENKFCSKDVAELAEKGYIFKIKPGYYAWQHEMEKLSDIEFVSQFLPQAVFAMYTAAQYHNMTTVNPLTVDVALPAEMRTPILPDYPPLTIYKSVRNIYKIGIEEIKIQNCTVKMYDRERTVCDFFRMRLQLGEDIALEVLKNYMAAAKNLQKLYEYADALKVKSVIKPYVESLI